MEHHSNIVPWQLLAERVGARIRVIPMDDAGQLDLDAYRRLLGPRTKIVGLVHISNALGTINPVAEMIEMAHAEGAPVLIDGAQAAPHQPIDVQALDCDFYTISSHKMFGPDGVGVLYGKADLLETMPPYQGGGEMIRTVAFDRTEYAPIPAKFEAGTPHISGVIALRAAIEYLEQLGWEGIQRHETDLLAYGTATLLEIPGVRLIGTAAHKASVLSFVLEGVHPHDIGTILDQEGIAIRTGHHCAQPVMERFGVPATARASLAFYNTRDEIDVLGRALHRVREIFG
jgi:cysteine desulfurase/selenocysteine lyase